MSKKRNHRLSSIFETNWIILKVVQIDQPKLGLFDWLSYLICSFVSDHGITIVRSE